MWIWCESWAKLHNVAEMKGDAVNDKDLQRTFANWMSNKGIPA
jgi:hypothetical protein